MWILLRKGRRNNMERISYHLLFNITVLGLLFAQVEAPLDCATDERGLRALTIESIQGGKHIPSIGDLKVLVVFTKLSSDNADYGSWPLSASQVNELPAFLSNIVNASVSDPPTSGNLTEYFDENSFQQLNMYGFIYPDIVTMNYAINFSNSSPFTRDLLNTIDPHINFQD